MIIGRVANLTQPHNGRGTCQYRNRCIRGCPYGAYFSSNAATLPAAVRDRPADAAPVLDRHRADLRPEDAHAPPASASSTPRRTRRRSTSRASIFLCASAIASTFILLNSKSERFPNGLGNDSGELGHNLMDHHFKVGANGAVGRLRRSLLQGTAPERHLHPALPQPRREVGAEGLRPRLRLSGQREPRELGARHQGAERVRRRPQGRSDRAGPVALRHRLMGRVPAVPREPHVPERRRCATSGACRR